MRLAVQHTGQNGQGGYAGLTHAKCYMEEAVGQKSELYSVASTLMDSFPALQIMMYCNWGQNDQNKIAFLKTSESFTQLSIVYSLEEPTMLTNLPHSNYIIIGNARQVSIIVLAVLQPGDHNY